MARICWCVSPHPNCPCNSNWHRDNYSPPPLPEWPITPPVPRYQEPRKPLAELIVTTKDELLDVIRKVVREELDRSATDDV